VEMRRARVRAPALRKRRRPEENFAPPEAGLLGRLKAWRLDQARAQSVPAFAIFQDRTLEEIARRRPQDIEALSGVAGIGAKKLERYGTELIELLWTPN
ncbi:MAG: HRDC domain-containing protein, partial [Betaproteobacteria bacterium]|nr:HRDC domain-containing protein [Betaproteobacteria bacterium]